jgi:hypothetical protein
MDELFGTTNPVREVTPAFVRIGSEPKDDRQLNSNWKMSYDNVIVRSLLI